MRKPRCILLGLGVRVRVRARVVVLQSGEEAQVQTAWDLQQLQSLSGRAEGEGDLEAVLGVQHQLGGALVVLKQRLALEREVGMECECPDTVLYHELVFEPNEPNQNGNNKSEAAPELCEQRKTSLSSQKHRSACRSSGS